MNRLKNTVAVVTGGGRGLGADISKRLADEGASVVLTYSKSREKAEAVAAEINAKGGHALAMEANSIDPKALTEAIQKNDGNIWPY
jgi:3-oxoacyl-[acyl-carrier protein] reductase